MKIYSIIFFLTAFISTAQVGQSDDVISVNFFRSGNIAKDGVDADFPGVVPGTWTNVVMDTNGLAIVDFAGTTLDISSSAAIRLSGNAAWDNWVNGAGPGCDTAGTQVTMTLSDIPYAQYYVIAYLSGWNGRKGSSSDGSTTYYYTMPTVDESNPPFLSQVTNTDSNSIASAVGSYVFFGTAENPLTVDSLTLTVSAIQANIGIGGFQIVKVPDYRRIGLYMITSQM